MKQKIVYYFIKYSILVILVWVLPELLYRIYDIYFYYTYSYSDMKFLDLRLVKLATRDSIRLILGLFIFLDLRKTGFKHSWLGFITIFSIPFAIVLLVVTTGNKFLRNEL